jgi:hypothetical protein
MKKHLIWVATTCLLLVPWSSARANAGTRDFSLPLFCTGDAGFGTPATLDCAVTSTSLNIDGQIRTFSVADGSVDGTTLNPTSSIMTSEIGFENFYGNAGGSLTITGSVLGLPTDSVLLTASRGRYDMVSHALL